MANIYNVNPSELIEKVAEELKKVEDIKPPEWSAFVKTGVSRERPPVDNDWWYVRTSSILRSVYKFGPIGVSKLRTKYGGKKNRGVKPERFYRASGNIIRKALQQLAKAEFIKEDNKGVHKGKVITPKGILLLSKSADILLGTSKGDNIGKGKKDIETPKTIKEKPVDKKTVKSEDSVKEEPKKESAGDPKQEKVPSAHELVAKKNE